MALILALYKLDQVRTIALGFRNMSIEVGLCFAGEKVFAARFKLGCKFKPLIFSLLQQAFTVSAVSRCFLPATRLFSWRLQKQGVASCDALTKCFHVRFAAFDGLLKRLEPLLERLALFGCKLSQLLL